MTDGDARWEVLAAGPGAAATMARIAARALPGAWPAPGFVAELEASGGGGWLVREAAGPGAPVGQLVLHRAADEAEIRSLAVLPEARGRGAASALLEVTLAQAGVRGVRVVHLEVRVGNAAARALYERAGFRVAGRRAGYYPDGEDALLLSRRLAASEVA